jgi:hypothetical protein
LLVVAGGFWAAGDVAASNIAAWDGQKWRTLGNVNGSEVWDVRALIVYNGQLIAAGGFSTGFGSPANCIARFDVATQSWKPLAGGGMNATVRALAIYNGDLVAAGFFTTAGGQAANHVARWNGTSWSQVGPGLPNTMISLAVLGGDLIAGASGVFRWNGTSWQQLGPTISVDVMAVHNGELYAGGGFTISSGGPADHIARWNGSSWQPLGAGLDDAPFALITYGNHLVAGGIFDHAEEFRLRTRAVGRLVVGHGRRRRRASGVESRGLQQRADHGRHRNARFGRSFHAHLTLERIRVELARQRCEQRGDADDRVQRLPLHGGRIHVGAWRRRRARSRAPRDDERSHAVGAGRSRPRGRRVRRPVRDADGGVQRQSDRRGRFQLRRRQLRERHRALGRDRMARVRRERPRPDDRVPQRALCRRHVPRQSRRQARRHAVATSRHHA